MQNEIENTENDAVLTSFELAERYGVTSKTVLEWGKSGLPSVTLPSTGPGRKPKGFKESEVIEWLKVNQPQHVLPPTGGEIPKSSGSTFADQLERARQMELSAYNIVKQERETGSQGDVAIAEKNWREYAEHLRKMENNAGKILEEERILVRVEIAERIMAKLAAEVKTGLRSIPVKLAPQMVRIEKPIDAKNKLQTEIDRILETLSKTKIFDDE